MLSKALDSAGYTEKSYYAVPGGFALATRLERINNDGTSTPEPSRWHIGKEPLSEFSISTYLKALFTAEPGYYRVIVFVITPIAFEQKDVSVTDVDAQHWLVGGLNKLPPPIEDKIFTAEFTCTALVYEFEQPTSQTKGGAIVPGHIPAKTHLIKAQIWDSQLWGN